MARRTGYDVQPSYGAPGYAPPSGSSGYPPPYSGSEQGYPNQSEQGYPMQQSSPSAEDPRNGAPSATGGISFEITPESAAVFVDGSYAGTAGNFGPQSEPLGLSSGRHHVEVRASGFRTMTFDADVRAGQVLPYRGTLQRN